MEQNKKFRLRLNLFDGIVLALALIVGAVVLWTALKPQAPAGETPAPESTTVQYTVRFQRMLEGTGQLVQPGHELTDTIKNQPLGKVVSTEIQPNQTQVMNKIEGYYYLTSVEGYEDVVVTMEASATESDTALTLDGGFELRCGSVMYLRGPGYMASGPILTIEREGDLG